MEEQENDFKNTMSAPKEGPLRVLWFGLLLIVISFGFKQVIVSFAMSNLGTALEEPKLKAEREAELVGVDDRDKSQEIYDKYAKKIKEAREDTASSGASAISKLQWFCNLKIVLDLIRLVGCVLILFSSFRIVTSSDADTPTKSMAVVFSGFCLLTMSLGSLITMMS